MLFKKEEFNNSTFFSPERRSSVPDYLFCPIKNLSQCFEFKTLLVRDILDMSGIRPPVNLPDHSYLTYCPFRYFLFPFHYFLFPFQYYSLKMAYLDFRFATFCSVSSLFSPFHHFLFLFCYFLLYFATFCSVSSLFVF